MKRKNSWTEAEDRALREWSTLGKAWKLLDIPGRTTFAITKRARALGIKNRRGPNIWTDERIKAVQQMHATGMQWKQIAAKIGIPPAALGMVLLRHRRRQEIMA